MTLKTTVLLPPCTSEMIPAEFSKDRLFTPRTPEHATLNQWIKIFEPDQEPRVILGSEDTPSIAWLAATRSYPNTRALIWQASEPKWQDIQTLEI